MSNERDIELAGVTAPAPSAGAAVTGRQSGAGASGSGRGLARLALLFGFVALVGVGYLYWRLVVEPVPLEPRVTLLEQRLVDMTARLERTTMPDADTIRQEVDRVAAELRQSFDERLRAAEAVGSGQAPTGSAETTAPPVPRDWQLAEARYLLRMANHRLLLERDPAGAATLLHAADEVLRTVDDFAFHEVRARIAAETLALESLPAADAEGLFLQIEAIKGDLDRLPLRLPQLEPLPPAAVEPVGIWAMLAAEVRSLVRFRQFDGAVRPLLAPEEAVYLELNLRLMLERAQLAGMRAEQTIYAQSIATALEWVERYLDLETPEVRRVHDGLRALARVSPGAVLPDISGSLNALNAVNAAAGAPVPGS